MQKKGFFFFGYYGCYLGLWRNFGNSFFILYGNWAYPANFYVIGHIYLVLNYWSGTKWRTVGSIWAYLYLFLWLTNPLKLDLNLGRKVPLILIVVFLPSWSRRKYFPDSISKLHRFAHTNICEVAEIIFSSNRDFSLCRLSL